MEDLEDINVLTLNTWGLLYISRDIEARMKAISEELAKGMYHLVHLQEVWSSRHYEMICEKVKHVLPYAHYFHSGFIGSGCATFSRYPILETFFYKYSHNGYFWDIFHGDWFGGKGIGCAIIKHPKRKIYSFNTHLHADYHVIDCRSGLDECRTLQSYQLAQFVRQVTRPGDAVIVSGDMNHTPDSLGIKALLELTGLRDTYAIAPNKPSKCNTLNVEFNKYLGGSDVTSRIDFIFSSNDFECISCNLAMQKIPNTDLHFSDHEGYTATLQLNESDENNCLEYVDSAASKIILEQLHMVMKKGEQLSDEIRWKKALSLCIMFIMFILMPVFSSDTFHVLFPTISTWYGKAVFILQGITIVFCAVYLWVISYIRVTDVKAFKGVSSEIKVRLHAHEVTNDRKVR